VATNCFGKESFMLPMGRLDVDTWALSFFLVGWRPKGILFFFPTEFSHVSPNSLCVPQVPIDPPKFPMGSPWHSLSSHSHSLRFVLKQLRLSHMLWAKVNVHGDNHIYRSPKKRKL